MPYSDIGGNQEDLAVGLAKGHWLSVDRNIRWCISLFPGSFHFEDIKYDRLPPVEIDNGEETPFEEQHADQREHIHDQ